MTDLEGCDTKIKGFICRSILDDMFICEVNKLEKEIERLKKHIELGHKGSMLDPRDYRKELSVLIDKKTRAVEVYEYFKSKCPK